MVDRPRSTGAGGTLPGADAAEDADARVSSREALRFLTRAGRMLSASLDPDQTLERIVRLAVPRVACFAALDLARDDDRLERVGFAHIDATREPLLERVEPFNARVEGLLPLARVLETGQPLMMEDIEADWPRDLPEDLQGLERLRRLAARSLIVVPLVVRGATLGTLTLGSTRTDRFYGSNDLALARELARSAGLALENARLYRESQRAIRARDEVLSVVSHDLRNPVGRVRMAAELLLEAEPVADSARGPVGIILRAADEMTRLIADLLDVARIEEGRLSLEPGPVQLATLLEHLEQAHAAMAQKQGVEWRVERPPSPPALELDEGRVMQALGNLIGNALKFTPRGGTVRVETRLGPDGIRIGVLDSGPGMSAEQLAHVFDRFWQARPGDRRGAGLGLAIARGIAQAHGGRLWLESEEGQGTRAWLELPR
ncbi:MAG TPA: GAF domain-containing sensor histidine kinase [Longimicrobiales bacterium]|nr:GAF domain-containing sensor histidine kinase [Longimicrobiales bacterium]